MTVRNGCRLWALEVAPSATHSGGTRREVRWVPIDQERPDWRHAGGLGTGAKVVKCRLLTDDEARRYLAGGLPLREIHV